MATTSASQMLLKMVTNALPKMATNSASQMLLKVVINALPKMAIKGRSAKNFSHIFCQYSASQSCQQNGMTCYSIECWSHVTIFQYGTRCQPTLEVIPVFPALYTNFSQKGGQFCCHSNVNSFNMAQDVNRNWKSFQCTQTFLRKPQEASFAVIVM